MIMSWWKRKDRGFRPSPERDLPDPPSWREQRRHNRELEHVSKVAADGMLLYTLMLRGEFRAENRPVTASLIWHFLPENRGATIIGHGPFPERRITEALEFLVRGGWLQYAGTDPNTHQQSYIIHPDKLR
jgi:hypothetical protein